MEFNRRARGRNIHARESLLDRAITYLNPEQGLRRFQSKVRMAAVASWTGARKDRRATQTWGISGGSADDDLLDELETLRERSRSLMRNNPLARGAINTVTTSAIGSGLRLELVPDSEALGMTTVDSEKWADDTRRKFMTWADDPRACDAAATLTFAQLQNLVFRSALENGDAFALLPIVEPTATTIYGTRINLVEADRCSTPSGKQDNANRVAGVKINDLTAPLGYWFEKSHPGSAISLSKRSWDFVPAFGSQTGRRNVIHLYDKRRIGQTRGAPYLAPVIEALKQLGDYTENELTAAVVNGLFAVAIKTESGEGLSVDPTEDAGGALSGSDLKLGAGAIIDLRADESIDTVDPKRPNMSFDPFVQAVLRQVGVALELPFEILIKHFTASYSASRAAMIEAFKFYKERRTWLAVMFCGPVFEAWLDEAVALGEVAAPGYFSNKVIRAAYLHSEWRGDAPGQLDPMKETNAAKLRVDSLLSTYSEETWALSGRSFEANMRKRERENEIIKETGNSRAIQIAPQPAPLPLPTPDGSEPNNDKGDLEGGKATP